MALAPPAYVDAFRFISVQPTDVTITADAVNDTLTLVAGSGIALVANSTNDQITVVNTGPGIGSFTDVSESDVDATYYLAFTRDPVPEEYNEILGAYQMNRLYFDKTNTPVTYNPSTSTLTASTFVGNLTGDISGNAATVTNGVYTTSSYSDPSWLTISASKVGLGNVTNESKTTMFTDPTFTGTVSGITAAMVGLGNVDNTADADKNVLYATTAGSAPASDVYAWAKEATKPTYTASEVGLGNVTNVAQEPAITAGTTAQYWRGDKTWQTLDSSAVGLGNVTNESKATMFTSPTFTGTVSGVTATMVGLGNVTNESKATMFTSPTFTGTTTLQQSTEVLNTKTSATGVVTHDFSTGAVWYHSSISANFTANFTNVPTTNNRAISCVLILIQGGTPYIPSAVQIDGAAQTINWLGGVPTGTASKPDVVSFTLIRVGSVWTVLGSLSTYG